MKAGAGETPGAAQPIRTEEPIPAVTMRSAVALRKRTGVIQESRFVASHARSPVAPAAAVIAPIMQLAHTGRAYGPTPASVVMVVVAGHSHHRDGQPGGEQRRQRGGHRDCSDEADGPHQRRDHVLSDLFVVHGVPE